MSEPLDLLRASQALRILDALENAKLPFSLAPLAPMVGWRANVEGIGEARGDTITIALAQLATAITLGVAPSPDTFVEPRTTTRNRAIASLDEAVVALGYYAERHGQMPALLADLRDLRARFERASAIEANEKAGGQ